MRAAGAAVPVALISLICVICVASARAGEDPLGGFLRGLADSTDSYFGAATVEFDTTGVDSLLRAGGDPALLGKAKRPGRVATSFWPVSRFHRAEGAVLGAGVALSARRLGRLEGRGAYGFANEEGRYEFRYSKRLWSRRPEGESGFRQIRGSLRYARETIPIAAEHAEPLASSTGASFTGLDAQSVFERRGLEVGLSMSSSNLEAGLLWRDAREQPMPLATRRSLLGERRAVKQVTLAERTRFDEVAARIGFHRWAQEFHAGVEAQSGGAERWRLRAAVARSTRLGRYHKLCTQVEAGIAAESIPPQLRFELGGPRAVPSLAFGKESGNRLLLGTAEVVSAFDLMRAIRLPRPEWLILKPALFGHAGAAWQGPEMWNHGPPDAAWRGAAGIALVHIPGFPSPATYWRVQYAWPVGRESGVPRLSVQLGDWMHLVRWAGGTVRP